MTEPQLYDTGSRQLGADIERRREEVDAHSRPGAAPLAGKSLAGADRPGAAARVGSLCDRWEPGCGWNGAVTWVGNPTPIETKVTRAEAPKALEYGDMRWELEPSGSGTRLTLWTKINRGFVSMGAADGTFLSMFWITFSAELPSAASLAGCHEVRRLAAAERRVRRAVRSQSA